MSNRLATIAARQTKSRLSDRVFALAVSLVTTLTAASILFA